VGCLNTGRTLDEVVVTLFRAPVLIPAKTWWKSPATLPYVLQEIIRACIQQGARLPVPASLPAGLPAGQNGFDPGEAVADLIASNTEASRQAALKNIRGGFSTTLRRLREQLITFSA